LAFVVPGVVSPNLPDAFARPAAYGDLIAAILALLAVAGLRLLLITHGLVFRLLLSGGGVAASRDSTRAA
jgi:hypothetical protein